jgi:DNA invertase Pin-like site-specific DNA recombinase
MDKNRAVIYLRVSTDEQTEESQLPECERFCQEKGYRVIAFFKDHAKSAYKNIKRPEYDKIMKMIKNREVDHVVVWAIDRWMRKGYSELKNNIMYLSSYDVQLHSVKDNWIENINLPGSMGMLMRDFFFGLMAWLAEEESERRSERVLSSEKFQKAKKKGTIGRKEISQEVKDAIIEKLKEGKSYRQIHNEVTYKIKHGKVKHVSIGKVSEIAKMCSKKVNVKI